MSIDIHEQSTSTCINICSICRDPFTDTKSSYKLPECNHEFHTDCLFSWFRNGNGNCPYCNGNPIIPTNNNNTHTYDYDYQNWYISLSKNRAKINVIKSFAKKKNCPGIVKRKIKNINSHELQYKSFIKQRKELNNKVGLYKDLKKEEAKLRTKQRAKIRSIRNMENTLLALNIVPLVILKHK